MITDQSLVIIRSQTAS